MILSFLYWAFCRILQLIRLIGRAFHLTLRILTGQVAQAEKLRSWRSCVPREGLSPYPMTPGHAYALH